MFQKFLDIILPGNIMLIFDSDIIKSGKYDYFPSVYHLIIGLLSRILESSKFVVVPGQRCSESRKKCVVEWFVVEMRRKSFLKFVFLIS